MERIVTLKTLNSKAMKYTKEEYEKAKEWWNNLSDADEQKYFSQLKEFFNSYRELIVAAYYRFGQ